MPERIGILNWVGDSMDMIEYVPAVSSTKFNGWTFLNLALDGIIVDQYVDVYWLVCGRNFI